MGCVFGLHRVGVTILRGDKSPNHFRELLSGSFPATLVASHSIGPAGRTKDLF